MHSHGPALRSSERDRGTSRSSSRPGPRATIAGQSSGSGTVPSAMPCEVLDRSLREAAPDAAMLEGLGAAGRKQIRYWRSGRVGEIIFNSWD